MEDSKYNILLIEDDEFDQKAFQRFIEDEKLPYFCTMTGSISEAKNMLDLRRYDVIISDYLLSDGTALDILDLVKNIPIIVITGAGNEQVAVSAWKGGAFDYLSKDLERNYLKALPQIINNAIKREKVKQDARYKVMLVEDDKLDRMAFLRFIEKENLKYDCKAASSISEAKEILDSETFDIIVSDFSLGDGTALDVFNITNNTPIILVTGAGDEEVAIKAWKAGAYDYLPKDVDRRYLKAIPKTIQNTIERRKMEEALDRKKKNLEAIFDAVPVGMLLVDEQLIITRANDAIRRMLGCDYSEIINKTVSFGLGCNNDNCNDEPDNDRACADCLLKKTVQSVFDTGRSVHNFEVHPVMNKEEQEKFLCFRLSVEPVEIDGCKHVVVAIDDITERKRAELERRLAEDRYRTIFENSAVAITVADDQERLISWNKFTEGLLGMSEKELYHKPIRSLYAPGEWERIRAYDIRQKGMQHHLETKMIKGDDNIVDVDISISVLKNSDGKTEGSIGVIRDITERRRAEEKTKETMELKSQFISTVSHELRTPLVAMKEGVAIVLDGVLGEINEEQKRFLVIAKRNADRLGLLINDVLDFQKMEADRMKPNIMNNDIEQVVSEVHSTMVLVAEKNKVEIMSDCAEGLHQAEFDRSQIIQVMTNLLSNAIKFTPEKGRVYVNVHQQNEELVISVSDTGMGIPKEDLPKIFERFYRVNRRGHEIPGTGLGLAIVYKIVIMHGGRIDVESELDKGTTFTVYLPIKSESVTQDSDVEMDEVLEESIAES